MENRVVLITGAKGGLGTYVTQTFLAANANVSGVSRSIQQSDFDNDRFTAFAADVTESGAANNVVQQIVQRFGRLDALVHVAGGFAAGKVHEMDDAAWTSLRDLNLTAGFNIMRAVLPHMREANYGRIVVVGSLSALQPAANLGAYVAFKSAMTVLTQTVAIENRNRGITANVVLPGTMDTPGNRAAMPKADRKTWVSPQDVADAIFALANDSSGQLTGALVPVSSRNV
jgi:NAD(P)-dependent dehydrogenase (short-subunit alcohol dehydrogenase family)